MKINNIEQKISRALIFPRYSIASKGKIPQKHLSNNDPVLLDTSLGSQNAGDYIIMHFAERQLSMIWPRGDFNRIATHVPTRGVNASFSNDLKILCGTNAISANADKLRTRIHWIDLPSNPSIYAKSILTLAVGMRDMAEGEGISSKTASVLRYLLTDEYLHSVRDSNTERALRSIGIENVINTACVTMWDLTPEFCASIPINKATDVLTTITDYGFDSVNDGYMLRTLKKHYRNVYLWVQGSEDLDKLHSMPESDGIELVQGGFAGLEQFVKEHGDIDYFGTRLHCGIYCLNHKIRSMIVTIDNRAADIQRDTNIPTVNRPDLKRDMERLIEQPRSTDIHIPVENIQRWKEQFRK